jgi:hypothetical protein
METTCGMENGKKYFAQGRWTVRWKDGNKVAHNISYPRWWWIENVGEIPDGYGVSYIDGDYNNIDPTNFECLPMSDLLSRGGKKNEGVAKSDEARRNMSIARQGMKLGEEHKNHIGDSSRKAWAAGIFDNVHKGEHNSHWRGGIPKEYPIEFKHMRPSILDRDNYMCGICGRSLSKSGQVHHVDGNRENNEPDNLLSLCTSCHGKIHGYADTSPVIMAFRSKLEWNL